MLEITHQSVKLPDGIPAATMDRLRRALTWKFGGDKDQPESRMTLLRQDEEDRYWVPYPFLLRSPWVLPMTPMRLVSSPHKTCLGFTGTLRANQKEALEVVAGRFALGERVITVEGVTAFGKTVTGLALAAQRKVRTLVLSPMSGLCPQWEEKFREFTSGGTVGHVQGTRVETDKDFIIAMCHTLSQAKRADAFRQDPGLQGVGLVLVDEVHMMPDMVARALAVLPPCRVVGLSATVDDGAWSKAREIVTGPIVCSLGEKSRPPVTMIVYDRRGNMDNARGMLQALKAGELRGGGFKASTFGQTLTFIANDNFRTQVVVQEFMRHMGRLPRHHRGMTLTDRKRHRDVVCHFLRCHGMCELPEEVPEDAGIVHDAFGIIVDAGQSQKLKARNDLIARHARVLVGTYGKLGTAMDIADVQCVAFVSPHSSKPSQPMGRSGRGEKNKHLDMALIDVLDTDNAVTMGFAQKRYKEYQSRDCPIDHRIALKPPGHAFAGGGGAPEAAAGDKRGAPEEGGGGRGR